MASPTPSPKGSNAFVRQGHTASQFGTDPSTEAKGKSAQSPRDLKP